MQLQYARRAPAQNVSTRRNGPRPETRPTGPRPRHIVPRPRRDPRRIVRDETLVRLETKASRPRPHLWRVRAVAWRHSDNKSVKRWNAAARLYSVAMGHIPRSTKRISSLLWIWKSVNIWWIYGQWQSVTLFGTQCISVT